MSKYTITGEMRTLVGKKVKSIRLDGKTPATIYGKEKENLSISVPTDTFLQLYKEAGKTGLIELIIGGNKHPVLVEAIQIDHIHNTLLNIEFHEVNLKEKVHATVSLEMVGEPTAITEKLGVLLTLIDQIEVEALPTDLPEKIEVDISGLAAVNDQITVGDIKVPDSVTILTDKDIMIAKISAFIVEKEPEPVVAEVAPETATATEEGKPEGTKEEPAKEE